MTTVAPNSKSNRSQLPASRSSRGEIVRGSNSANATPIGRHSSPGVRMSPLRAPSSPQNRDVALTVNQQSPTTQKRASRPRSSFVNVVDDGANLESPAHKPRTSSRRRNSIGTPGSVSLSQSANKDLIPNSVTRNRRASPASRQRSITPTGRHSSATRRASSAERSASAGAPRGSVSYVSRRSSTPHHVNVDSKEVNRRWQQALRARDLEAERGVYGDETAEALAAAREDGQTDARDGLELALEQQHRRYVEPPESQLQKEIPYDYIRLARWNSMRRAREGPDAVVAGRYAGAYGDGEGAGLKTHTKFNYDINGEQGDGSDGYSVGDNAGAGRHGKRRVGPNGELLSDDDADYGHRDRDSVEFSKAAYDKWRRRQAGYLYKHVYVDPVFCESNQVPPLFEPALTPEERAIYQEIQQNTEALNRYQELSLRYRLATQDRAKKTTIEEIKLSRDDAEKYIPVVRAIRYLHEEENFAAVLNTVKHNMEALATGGDGVARDYATYQQKLDAYNAQVALRETELRKAQAADLVFLEQEEAAGREKGESETTRLRGRAAADSADIIAGKRGPRTASAGINSATTPGWMRHREFSQMEWTQLSAGNSASNRRHSAPPGRRSQANDAASATAAAPEAAADQPSTSTRSQGASTPQPRAPNVPAWMHHLNTAQEEQNQNDPQYHKLNEIDTTSVLSISRARASVGYSVGQSSRMNNRGGGGGDDETSLIGGPESGNESATHFSIARPTRVDVSNARQAVVDNDVDVRNPAYETVESPDLLASESEPAHEVAPLVASAEQPAVDAQPLQPPVLLQRVMFPLYPFSSFEVTQELKRVTWWCAAHRVDHFTVLAGEEDSYVPSRAAQQRRSRETGRRTALRQPRSYSPSFFPGTARFYDEMIATAQSDYWLHRRIVIVEHDSASGEIEFEVLPSTLREASRDGWLVQRPEDDEVQSADGQNTDNALEFELSDASGSASNRQLNPNATLPPPPTASTALMNSRTQTARLCFFTSYPHPSGNNVNLPE